MVVVSDRVALPHRAAGETAGAVVVARGTATVHGVAGKTAVGVVEAGGLRARHLHRRQAGDEDGEREDDAERRSVIGRFIF
jgi:hypothetical protein